MHRECTIFDTLPDGRTVRRWRLRNDEGAEVCLIDLGAAIQRLAVPDRSGIVADVVLGFDSAAPYLEAPYFGAVVGRFANRIRNGRFELEGNAYQLALNDGPNSLHGGARGFDKQMWAGEWVETGDGPGVRFSLDSPDGDEGYPGAVTVSVTYVWTEDSRLIVDYAARSTRATPFNITQHSYFNLAGVVGSEGSVLDHELTIPASRYLPIDETLIPLAAAAPVQDSAFDFRTAKAVGRDLGSQHEQLALAGGFDHNWIIDGSGFRPVARLHDPASGRTLDIRSDLPGLQFYSGNFLDGTIAGKAGVHYGRRCALALETQYFPDSPNRPDFPDCTLRPGALFSSRTMFTFSC
ncbi:aldose epimerase family protein [Novosphingobium sp. BL-52-GroH]|uniref:aldose epimerase family protein n=1 Tax=Novosphingobium sp. BL-52-GroH TaxID=3349877 RepID=UPI00384DC58A